MNKHLFALISLLILGIAHAEPVPVTSCPFLMESNKQYILNQDLVCNTFPFSFIDLSLGPVNSSVNLNGYTVDAFLQNFIGDFNEYYEIEVYGGNVINCGTDGGGCIQWGGSGAGLLYVHDMIVNTTGNFITSINELPGTQRAENIQVFQESGFIVTGWFLDLQMVNVTSELVPPPAPSSLSIMSVTTSSTSPSGVFMIDGGEYFLNLRHNGFEEGNSDFDTGGDGVGSNGLGTSTVTLLDSTINPDTECGNGCDLVTWVVLDEPEPPIDITTLKDLKVKFQHSDADSIECEQCGSDKSNGVAMLDVNTALTHPEGCDYISDFLSFLSTLPNSVLSVHVDQKVCSDASLLSSMPILNLLDLLTQKSQGVFIFT